MADDTVLLLVSPHLRAGEIPADPSFPLSLVYRVTDIVLAEGTEAVFRFAIALLRKCEDQLLKLEFEELLAFLTGDLYECYRVESEEGEEQFRSNDFVRDAYETRM